MTPRTVQDNCGIPTDQAALPENGGQDANNQFGGVHLPICSICVTLRFQLTKMRREDTVQGGKIINQLYDWGVIRVSDRCSRGGKALQRQFTCARVEDVKNQQKIYDNSSKQSVGSEYHKVSLFSVRIKESTMTIKLDEKREYTTAISRQNSLILT